MSIFDEIIKALANRVAGWNFADLAPLPSRSVIGRIGRKGRTGETVSVTGKPVPFFNDGHEKFVYGFQLDHA